MRGCGILLHISSLPGAGGIGELGSEAYAFVDFLKAAGQSYWQVLPLTPPARGNSPYSSYSVFAGNPYFISLAALAGEGLLPVKALDRLLEHSGDKVDYAVCEDVRMQLLRESYAEGYALRDKQIAAFRRANSFWLEDYALFMALKARYGDVSYHKWEKPLLLRERDAMLAAKKELRGEVRFWVYVQYLFFTQWRALKRYANRNGVKIIGDMPIYADVESADVWANPSVFQLDETCRPSRVAGVPPDAFSADGQLWGNPLYDWDHLRDTGYAWWLQRLRAASTVYDVVRIDHFRGLESYFSIPARARSAKYGSWQKGPGMDFLSTVEKAIPGCKLIAEDLGMLTSSVHKLLADSGLPGMKVLLFAFSTAEESSYLPHNLPRHCVAYIGTHDNSTVQGWMKAAPADEVKFAKDYLHLTAKEENHWGFIRGLYASVADTAIVQMQDVLGLGDDCRMNIPATPSGNWAWRMTAPDEKLAAKLRSLAKLYGRLQEDKAKDLR